MGQRGCLYALAINALLYLVDASPSVPVATYPILVTATVTTVFPSVATVYSVVPATDIPPTPTFTTIIDDNGNTITMPTAVAGSVTSAIIYTISLTTSQVVTSTLGFSTIFGPDSTTPAASTSTPDAVPSASTAPLTTPIISQTSTRTSFADQTSSLVTHSSSASTNSTSSANHSSTSGVAGVAGVAGANSSSSSPSSVSSAKGLSTGAMVGIGIGVVIGVVFLAALSFLLGQRYSRRQNEDDHSTPKNEYIEKTVIFQAGRPYEMNDSDGLSPLPTSAKGHAYSMRTTVAGTESPPFTGKSYDTSKSPRMNTSYDQPDLSALPQISQEDEQMYVGMPSYMSGAKRWSTKEFRK